MLEGWELNFSEGRTFLLPTHSAEVMMYSNCTTKGNVNLVFLLSLGTKGLGLWGILSDQLNHPSSYSRAMAWACHKNRESRARNSILAPTRA